MFNHFSRVHPRPTHPGDAPRRSRRRWLGWLLAIVVAGLLCLSWGAGTAKAAPLLTYNCGNGQTSHCYSNIAWSGATNGVRTSIFTNEIAGGNCFVTNETWLIQGSYWVEAGVIADSDYYQDNDALFWADMRPNKGGLTLHEGATLSNNDLGKFANVQITKTSSSTFAVSITGLPQASLYGTSTANPINPNLISIGMELCGSTGAWAPWNGFTNNQYQDPANGNFYYQSTHGTTYIDGGPNSGYPTWLQWNSYPAGASNHGGDVRTCIAGSGC